jgi:hypothetical protein
LARERGAAGAGGEQVKCAACTGNARKLQRALVLTGPGRVRAGRVCSSCAKLGWLLVVGDLPDGHAPKRRASSRAPRRTASGFSAAELIEMSKRYK